MSRGMSRKEKIEGERRVERELRGLVGGEGSIACKWRAFGMDYQRWGSRVGVGG